MHSSAPVLLLAGIAIVTAGYLLGNTLGDRTKSTSQPSFHYVREERTGLCFTFTDGHSPTIAHCDESH